MAVRYGQQKYGTFQYGSLWKGAIYNRTIEDIVNQTAIAYCNAVDMNRLDGNCAALSEMFGLIFNSHAEWQMEGLPTEDEFARILSSIESFRIAFPLPSSEPNTPVNPLNTWQKWNDAEKILYDLYMLYHANKVDFAYAGEFYSGETLGVI